ncbi:GT2 family glycosyltransferase [Rhodoblastus acidophilus]|uniref:glycosyltransferase family 2 protein n=1 Tax=Rhodoblastus acidophilus TaxID=1074 RepID=UPI002225A100|nr:glycosyltransferase family 2 protein [Rhodoblastus acidophilus]MCW2286616.1 GT2 family glycosyltransferase [Rhodoblastus acidophilus]MCW2335472.1 GT2 family glycosyltransferase [Rhodoblastus acidophilus]
MIAPRFHDRARHAEALALRAAEHMRRGDFAGAFRFADRLCRVASVTALDLLLRSEAARGAGLEDRAAADLARALDLDPTQRTVLQFALQWGAEADKQAAARALIDDPAAHPELLRRAVAALVSGGAEAVLMLRPVGARLAGWAAFRTGATPDLLETRDETTASRLTADPQHFLRQDGVEAVHLNLDPAGLRGVRVRQGERELASWSAPPVAPPLPRAPQTAKLWIIVPVYEDLKATRACLNAAMAQLDADMRLVVIDDASPNPALRGWLDVAAASGRLELIRNPQNLGFAASVNRALEICRGGDVILLNADALPPPGAFARLAELARSAPDIGALTPLSNNGETCSFPAPNAASPLPEAEEIARLDALARQANGDLLIDLPNGIGFCLYITRACLDATGPLPEIYGRGYYEDVEFCLKARERGFRTVCAAGVYVGHAGSLSFGAEKRALVMRNMSLLKTRFPDHEAECAAFLRADPLRPARAKIERLDTPRRPFRLIVAALGACAGEAQSFAQAIEAEGEAPLLCLYDPIAQKAQLRAQGCAPNSLDFDLSAPLGLNALGKWLFRLRLSGITLFYSTGLPEALVEMLPGLGEVELAIAGIALFSPPARSDICAAPEGAQPCSSCAGAFTASEAMAARMRAWRFAAGSSATLRPLDRMSAHVAGRLFPQARILPPPDVSHEIAVSPGGRTLGVLSPQPCAEADALVLALAHALRRRGDPADIVVFGACLDDFAVMAPGNVLVSGPVEEAERAPLVQAYGVTELMSGSRAFGHGIDALAAACGLPRAGFDWSSGALPFGAQELALDPRLCDRKTAEIVADWLAARRAFDRGAAPRDQGA